MKNTILALLLAVASVASAEPKPLEIQGKPALRVLTTAQAAGAKPDAKGQWRVEGKLEITKVAGKDFFSTAYGMKLILNGKAYPVKRGSIELVDTLAAQWPTQSNEPGVWKVTTKVVVTAEEGNEADTALLQLSPPAQP